MIINMLTNKIYTTRSTDIEVGVAIIFFFEKSVQFIKAICDFRDIIINISKTRINSLFCIFYFLIF